MVRAILGPNDFFRDAHRRIFQAFTEAPAVDFGTVRDALRAKGELEEVGGQAYITALTDSIPIARHVQHYANTVRDHALRRALIFAANHALRDAYEASDTPLETISTAALSFAGLQVRARPGVVAHHFESITEDRYVLRVPDVGIVFDLDRLHRTHHELVGELAVTVNGSCPKAKGIDGIISSADLNLSSAQARVTRAKLLADRSGNKDLDWHGYVEELCVKVMKAERDGQPAVRFVDTDDDEEERSETILIDGFPVLKDHPLIVFGDPGAAKSYFALWIAGTLAQQMPVLYADWELTGKEHNKRLTRLFQPKPSLLYYIRCVEPLLHSGDRIRRIVKAHGIKYLVCDSIGPACLGRPEDAEQANAYIRELRSFGIGSLNLAHVSKRDSEDTTRDPKIFGSAFWLAGARSVWFIQRVEQSPIGQIQFGLYQKKNTFGDLLRGGLGYTLHFEHHRSRFERTKVQDVEELAAKLPLLDRMKNALGHGAMSLKALADDLNVQPPAIRAMLSRHKRVFLRVAENKIALKSQQEEF